MFVSLFGFCLPEFVAELLQIGRKQTLADTSLVKPVHVHEHLPAINVVVHRGDLVTEGEISTNIHLFVRKMCMHNKSSPRPSYVEIKN